MDSFFDSNPGFKSRVPFTFRFEAGLLTLPFATLSHS
jgi:hypothetical protein